MRRKAHKSQTTGMKWCATGFLLLVLCAGVQLHAQQSDADRKTFENRKAKAEQGDARFQCALGEIYDFGLYGVTKNSEEAVKWYRMAAEQNFAQAQYDLGSCYSTGQGIAKDDTEAVKCYRKAADQNLAQAQYNLGVCYHDGVGVMQDYAQAVEWFRKAANRGLADAQYNLGLCYDQGQGVPQNYAEAVKLYHKAAEQGFVFAQSSLGAKYGTGEGVPKDYREAYKWRLLAAAQGDKSAKQAVPALESVMTPEQIAEGQRLAAAFIPRMETPSSISYNNPKFSGTGFFITDDGYLISNYHVVKDATKVRLLTGAGLIDAKVVQVDAANDLALLKADGRFAPLPIAASRTGLLGGTVATVGFPDIGLQGFAPKVLAHGHHGGNGHWGVELRPADDPRYF